ncbi:MAG: AMP-dependent synthetase, partial [Bdellovibrio sp. CG10_big_fil_rev_8_21_14_0_10_47_8]
WNSINTTLRLNISQHDCSVIFLPFFHTGGWNVLTTPFFHRGARIIFLKKFDADRVLDLSDKEGATILFGVPTTMDMLARSNLFPSVKLDKVRYAIVGGEPMPIELIQTWHQRGIAIRQGYGLTEFGPNVFSLNEEDAIRKIGSIGFSNFYIETKVVDDHGQLVGPDQVGELWLKGPMCMTEYWNNPKATAETITDGWLHTGDLVRQDMDGYFYVVGRKKDMFKSGGENVYPAELEKVIRTLPGVREVAVIGVPDRKWGEVGKAFITLEPTATLTEQDLIGHCVKNLAKFKVPKFYSFIAELPKGDSGKILKRKLLDL